MPTKAQKKSVSSDEAFETPLPPSKKKSVDKIRQEESKLALSDKLAQDLGPEPKKPRTTFNYFNADFVKLARLKDPTLKSTDAFKIAAQTWSQLSEIEKAPYVEMYAADKLRYEKQLSERQEKGYFTMQDHSRSIDHPNEQRLFSKKKSSVT